MVNNKYYTKFISDLIAQDPTTLNGHFVTTSTPDGYGGVTTTKVASPVVCRLYKKSRSIQFIHESGVTASNGIMIKALAAGDITIGEGTILKSTEHDYKVAVCNNYFGICTQLELEVVR